MDKYRGGKEASNILGVHQRTLYNWDKKGLIKTIRTPRGKRLYNISNYLINNRIKNRLNICYVRVSSNGQKDDLDRQIKYMQHKYPKYLIIKDIGSGINMNRKGLNRIIDYAINGELSELVIAHKDRLSRSFVNKGFGYPLIERIITKYSNGKITVINKKINKSVQDEVVEDVLQIMNVFVAKMNGLRKYKI